MNCSGLATERPRCSWIQMMICRNSILAVNSDSMNFKQNNCLPNNCYYVSNMSVNGGSTILV